MRFTDREVQEMLKAWLIISLAFTIVMVGGSPGLNKIGLSYAFLIEIGISLFTVGLGFLLHELAHKLVAQHYGYHAEFHAYPNMLLLAIIMSFAGFVYAAPGAVFIHGRTTKEKNGRIAIAGPVTNIGIAILFLTLSPFSPNLASRGYTINAWLALFNMIPFANIDGAKVFKWNKKVFFVTFIFSISLLLLVFL